MNLREVYQTIWDDSEAGALARQLLDQQDWFASIAELDPKTGEALPLGFDEVLRRLNNKHGNANTRDRLWRIVEHSRASIERIFGSLSENPRREQAILPVRDVKELDATSFIALSRRPGRNVREKLAGKPYIQAVRRYQSVDLPQNQLVKVFVTQLADLLEVRKKCLGDEGELLGSIYHWLRSDEAQAISRWDNLPPNNTLLSHRDYRRVWDAWRWLQNLDAAIDSDFRRLPARAATVKKWDDLGKEYSDGKTLFGDMPVLFNYEEFTIELWPKPKLWPEPIRKKTSSVARPDGSRAAIAAPACVDLTYPRPRYAVHGLTKRASLPEVFVWQRWKNDHESVDLELFDADIVLLHPDATSVSSSDLFFASDTDELTLDSAAHAFTRKLSQTFASSVLIWLVPDFINDFQMQIARRNINARFAEAEPLPRSIAAVFEKIEYSKIKKPGYQVLIVDSAGGTTYATKLTAIYDPDLLERVPETRGFYWERSPHVTIEHNETDRNPLTEVPYIDSDGRWNAAAATRILGTVDNKTLRSHPQIGRWDLHISLSDSPVSGGIGLYELQQRAGDIPLWRDHIPELSIKVIKDGRYQPFYLVDRKTTIKPLRGVPVPIEVNEIFTLPAGKRFYQFPLFQGHDPDDLGYVARLESPIFPLPADVMCRLKLEYAYGADDPYRLHFEPLDKSFKAVQARWEPKTEEVVTDAPAPEYPRPTSWSGLQETYNSEKGEITNFPEWATSKTEELLDRLSTLDNIFHGTIKTDWKTNANGWHFAFAERDHDDDVYINEKALAGRASYSSIAKGDDVYFVVAERNGRTETRYVAKTAAALNAAASKDLVETIRKGLYVPYIRTWSDGRSLTDPQCPERFRKRMTALLPMLADALHSAHTPPPVQNEIKFLFCCMHRDMPEPVSTQLVADLKSATIDERFLSFALGDLSQAWQRDIFSSLMSKTNARTLRILARAIWRNEGFVRAFGAVELTEVASLTFKAIHDANDKSSHSRYDVACLTSYCELLLGLLRGRDSEDHAARMLLQPHQAITKQLAEQIERTIAVVARESIPLESRVQVANLPPKPAGEKTPDLLFALRLYLTGDVGSNAIRVTGVNEGEDH